MGCAAADATPAIADRVVIGRGLTCLRDISRAPPRRPYAQVMQLTELVTETFLLYQSTSSVNFISAVENKDQITISVAADRHYRVTMSIPRDKEDPEWKQFSVDSIEDWVRYAVFYRIVELYETGVLASSSTETLDEKWLYAVPAASPTGR